MIINNKYKIVWKHYDKDRDITLSEEEIENEIQKILESKNNKEDTKALIANVFNWNKEANKYTKSHSKCEIFMLMNDAWELIGSGISIVHPYDKFDRKKGVFLSLKDATLERVGTTEESDRIIDRATSSIIWKAFWKARQKKPITVGISGDMNLKKFLEHNAKKRVVGNITKYTIPKDIEIHLVSGR